MDVKDFISESLRQIIDGVKDAQKHAEKNGAYVSPDVSRYVDDPAYTKSQNIEFDIAVTSQESSEKGGKGGLKIPIPFVDVEAGAEAKSGRTNGSISRIKFEVAVKLPAQAKK